MSLSVGKAVAIKGLQLALFGSVALAIAGCGQERVDPDTQIGPDPVLPAPRQYLVPPMHVAPVGVWRGDERPTVGAKPAGGGETERE